MKLWIGQKIKWLKWRRQPTTYAMTQLKLADFNCRHNTSLKSNGFNSLLLIDSYLNSLQYQFCLTTWIYNVLTTIISVDFQYFYFTLFYFLISSLYSLLYFAYTMSSNIISTESWPRESSNGHIVTSNINVYWFFETQTKVHEVYSTLTNAWGTITNL